MLLATEVLALQEACGWINSYHSDTWSLQKAGAHGSPSSFRPGLCTCGMWRHCSSLAVSPSSASVSLFVEYTCDNTSCGQPLYPQLFLPILSGRKDRSAIPTCVQYQLETMLGVGEAGHSASCHMLHQISLEKQAYLLDENRMGSVAP